MSALAFFPGHHPRRRAGRRRACLDRVARAQPGQARADQRRGAARGRRGGAALGYRPNRAASALRTGRTHTIGVLVPDITNPVFPPILQGIEASAAARGYFVFVTNVMDHALARPVVERMLAQQVDGLVMATATRDDPLVDYLKKAGMHAVLVNRADESGRLPAVVSDDRLAMKLAVDHLVSLGHRRIAHLAGPQNVPDRRRRAGRAWSRRCATAGSNWPASSNARATAAKPGRKAMRQLLAQNDARPRPWCAATTWWRWAPTTLLREQGLRVPQDISITGHNDMPLVDMVDPPLTTIRLPHRELGWRAAEMLFDEIEGKALSASTVVLRPELVVRESTRELSPR